MVTSAFGARLATSIATLYGCAGTSSGATSSGVWMERTKSRDTVNTKSARLVYMLVRKSWTDRKSTRLNSSHQIISYAVFCLKKKRRRLRWMKAVGGYLWCGIYYHSHDIV